MILQLLPLPLLFPNFGNGIFLFFFFLLFFLFWRPIFLGSPVFSQKGNFGSNIVNDVTTTKSRQPWVGFHGDENRDRHVEFCREQKELWPLFPTRNETSVPMETSFHRNHFRVMFQGVLRQERGAGLTEIRGMQGQKKKERKEKKEGEWEKK